MANKIEYAKKAMSHCKAIKDSIKIIQRMQVLHNDNK